MTYFPKHTDWTNIGPLTARSIINRHYSVKCTEKQARDEVLSLARKHDKGSLDDADMALMSGLLVAYGLLDIAPLARTAYRDWKAD